MIIRLSLNLSHKARLKNFSSSLFHFAYFRKGISSRLQLSEWA